MCTNTHSGLRQGAHYGSVALLGALLMLASAACAFDWDIERVDDGLNLIEGGLGLVVDANGTPHIISGLHPSQVTRYATKVGSQWLIEQVDGYPSGVGATIALDAAGQPYVAYLKGSSLMYAQRRGGTWVSEYVDAAWEVRCALVLNQGVPHIAYTQNGDPWYLRHAWKPGGAWQFETVDSTVASGHDVHMLVDSHNRLCLSHWAAPNYGGGPFHEKYSWWDGAAWQHSVIDPGVQNCNVIGTGLGFDSSGYPHVVYEDHGCWWTSAVNYAAFDGAAWQITTLDTQMEGSAGASLVVDKADAVHIVYGTDYMLLGGTSQLHYAHQEGGNWVIDMIDTDGDAGEVNALALDRFGFLHVAYFRGLGGTSQYGEIRYARSRTPVRIPGDMNCDGAVNFDDINPFVLALSDPPGWHAAYPDCNLLNGDVNGDGAVDFQDINPFVALLSGGLGS